MAVTRVETIEVSRNVFQPLTYEAATFDVTEELLREIESAKVNPIAVDVVTDNRRTLFSHMYDTDIIPEGYYYTAGISPRPYVDPYWTTFPNIYKTPDEARCAVYLKWKKDYLGRIKDKGKDFVDMFYGESQ